MKCLETSSDNGGLVAYLLVFFPRNNTETKWPTFVDDKNTISIETLYSFQSYRSLIPWVQPTINQRQFWQWHVAESLQNIT